MSPYEWPGGAIPVPVGTDNEAVGNVPKWIHVPSFTATPGRVVLLTGDSGTGKSFFLGILSGTASPGLFRERKIRKYMKSIPKVMGAILVPQFPEIRQELTVRQEVLHTWRANLQWEGGLEESAMETRFAELVEKLDLGDVVDRQISQLSGGTLKRVSLLLRLPLRAPVIMLDEPDSGLDDRTFRHFLERLIDARFFEGTPPCFIIVTHKPEIFRDVAGDRVDEVRLQAAGADDLVPPPPWPDRKTDSGAEPPGCTWKQLRDSLANALSLIVAPTWRGELRHTLLALGMAAVVIALVCMGEKNSGSTQETGDRLNKHAFFALIACMWMGLQLSARHVIAWWASWREDTLWRASLRRQSLRTDTFAPAWYFLAGLWGTAIVGAIGRSLVGLIVFTAIGKISDWFNVPVPDGGGYLLFLFIMASLYGTSLGIAGASLTASLAIARGRRPGELALNLLIPLTVLAHLVFSARFLASHGAARSDLFTDFVHPGSLGEITKRLPTNHLTGIFESFVGKASEAGHIANTQSFWWFGPPLWILTLVIISWFLIRIILASPDTRSR
ncbi:ABC-type multidrug transport system, ATPase component [Opitutaceae bacterium TAV1]|nr:ABC-type multidrug transport system, ATPase component [Opitutaceae bacterium TAV1]